MGKVVGGFPQGDPAVPVWFGAAMVRRVTAMLDKRKRARLALAKNGGDPGDVGTTRAGAYVDDITLVGRSLTDTCKCRAAYEGKLAEADNVIISRTHTRAEVRKALSAAGLDPDDFEIHCKEGRFEQGSEESSDPCVGFRQPRPGCVQRRIF